MNLSITKLTEHIGAEVRGIDVTAPIDEEAFVELRHALVHYSVLVLHDQDITDEQQVAFTAGFVQSR